MGLFDFFCRKKPEAKLFYRTDVHSHILPGVDHGSQDVVQSLEMLRAELDMGIDRVILTSHVTAETFENTVESLTSAYELLCAAVRDAGLPVELYVSAEYRMDDYWDRQWAAGTVLPMPGNFLLLENSFQQERLGLEPLIYELRTKGYIPILAHPERYGYYGMRTTRYASLHDAGAKFQVNLLSLAGYFGKHAREAAVWLIKNGLVDMLGSDMHNIEHAQIIKDYLRTRDWQKLRAIVENDIINDRVR
ncbi:MAG: hypothetical protein IJT30_02175 [Muribaculaceae bacterium]|nr:hypothetical protein [Muribaculaceae bacterium]